MWWRVQLLLISKFDLKCSHRYWFNFVLSLQNDMFRSKVGTSKVNDESMNDEKYC